MRAKIPQSARDGQQPPPFATLLNQLFATRLSPEGRPYTLTEVSQATGISVPYLSYVRKGTIGAVPVHRAAPLARFFGVPLDYFSQDEPPSRCWTMMSGRRSPSHWSGSWCSGLGTSV